MEFKQIKELVKLVNETGLSEFLLENKDFKLTIRSKDYTNETTVTETKIVSVPAAPMPAYPAPQYAPPVVAPVAPPVAAPVPAPAASPAAAPAAPAAEKEDNSNYVEITSPIVGTFYRSPTPEKGAYIQVGDTVSKDTVVCIVEAMKLFNEIEAEVSGKIIKVLTEDASPVEYGQPLFLVDPNG